MQIGELAKRAGVSVQTIRFYERQGLLPEPQRKDSGYRIYGEGDLRRLRFVINFLILEQAVWNLGGSCPREYQDWNLRDKLSPERRKVRTSLLPPP